MAWALTEEAFARLMKRLDSDPERAGERYEELRQTLLRFFEWRGASFPEERTDETLNRLARKLEEGQEIADIGPYLMGMARLVLLETFKGRDRLRASLDDVPPETATLNSPEEADEKESYLLCLETCLQRLPADNRELITTYYQDEHQDRIKKRLALAERLGLRRTALANRAQRVRDKLEECVGRCVQKN